MDALLTQNRVTVVDTLPSRKTALKRLAESIASGLSGLTYREIFFALEAREQEGSTVLDELPMAIPHCRIEKCLVPVAAVVKTRGGHGVDFGGARVQLLVGMCFPRNADNQALDILRLVIKVVEDEARRQRLLSADTPSELFEAFHGGLQEEADR